MTAYLDGLTVATNSVTGSRWLLRGFEKNMNWAKMKFKPAKPRSFVIEKGQVTDKYRFAVAGTNIPTLSEKAIG